MTLRTVRSILPAFMILLIAALACNLPIGAPAATQASVIPESPSETSAPPSVETASEKPTLIPFTPTPLSHVTTPSDTPPPGKLVYDVVSEDTAPEKRAPYGDSYDINRFERPFLQDMTYIPDLDIAMYTVSEDTNFWYVSIELIGTDPNNALGINYGVELDKDHDGFGDFIIWANPPYSPTWDTLPVQIFADNNHNTGGLSGEHSDAPITTDGYETKVFNGGLTDADPDLAWVRVNAGYQSTVQFAFKKSWSGSVFMIGVIADAGLRDVTKLDYVDRFTEEEAGSSVKDKKYYPLKALFAVDNTCQEAFGFKPTGYEAKLCPPPDAQSTNRPGSTPPITGCQPPPGGCGAGFYWWPAPHCACSITPPP